MSLHDGYGAANFRSERHAALDASYPSACTGNCNQGRMCDCVPDVPLFDSDPKASRAIAFALALAVAMVLALLMGWV